MAVEKRALTCIVCPKGCAMTATITDGLMTELTGNSCPRGKKYAEEEILAPKRMLTSTVRVLNGELALLPVVSKSSLPKGRILACVEELRKITVLAPIAEGQVIVTNILGLGVDIVASRSMPAAEKD
ncbi:MAG: DUF1667 domain-containing protein [Acholeplasmataceae bacterium]|nr:DUF1667 domain-containing protein [Acidaminococcaceae bacterium]NLY83741.1 DUF1667 domain-containing protein [Acholeplasmataceae bacterium]